MSVRYWIHGQRAKHHRHMARSQSFVEQAQALERWGDPVKGWHYITKAIDEVVRCGCPRSMWREAVRDALPNPESKQ